MIDVSVKLYSKGIALRDIQFPSLKHEGFSLNELSKPVQYRENLSGKIYDVMEFKTKAFATKHGNLIFGPGVLEANMVVKKTRSSSGGRLFDDFFRDDFFDDFFGRAQLKPVRFDAAELEINVLPLPQENKPADYSGAVGKFHIQVDAKPREVKVGDPITLYITISGQGNFQSVSMPNLDDFKDFKIYSPEVNIGSNKKSFEVVLIPESEDITSIPAVHFSFFNPETSEYISIESNSIPLIVNPNLQQQNVVVVSSGETEAKIVQEEFGKDIIFIKEKTDSYRKRNMFFYQRLGFWLGHFIIFIFAGALWLLFSFKERFKSDVLFARRLYASKEARKALKDAKDLLKQVSVRDFYGLLFKIMQDYLANKLNISRGSISADYIKRYLESTDVSEEILREVVVFFSECEAARFSPDEAGFNEDKKRDALKSLIRIIDFFERLKL